jgi:hypothetical protein
MPRLSKEQDGQTFFLLNFVKNLSVKYSRLYTYSAEAMAKFCRSLNIQPPAPNAKELIIPPHGSYSNYLKFNNLQQPGDSYNDFPFHWQLVENLGYVAIPGDSFTDTRDLDDEELDTIMRIYAELMCSDTSSNIREYFSIVENIFLHKSALEAYSLIMSIMIGAMTHFGVFAWSLQLLDVLPRFPKTIKDDPGHGLTQLERFKLALQALYSVVYNGEFVFDELKALCEKTFANFKQNNLSDPSIQSLTVFDQYDSLLLSSDILPYFKHDLKNIIDKKFDYWDKTIKKFKDLIFPNYNDVHDERCFKIGYLSRPYIHILEMFVGKVLKTFDMFFHNYNGTMGEYYQETSCMSEYSYIFKLRAHRCSAISNAVLKLIFDQYPEDSRINYVSPDGEISYAFIDSSMDKAITPPTPDSTSIYKYVHFVNSSFLDQENMSMKGVKLTPESWSKTLKQTLSTLLENYGIHTV